MQISSSLSYVFCVDYKSNDLFSKKIATVTDTNAPQILGIRRSDYGLVRILCNSLDEPNICTEYNKLNADHNI